MSEHPDDKNRNDSPVQETTGRPVNDLDAALYAFVNSSVDSTYAAERHSVDTVFEVLTQPGRRYVLTYLLQSDGFVTLSELVDYVLTKTDASTTDDGFRRELAVELSHRHLPELEEHGFIRYDMERQLVMATDLTGLTEPYLRIALAQADLAERRRERE